MRQPVTYTASEIVNWPNAEKVDLKWRPSRPCGYTNYREWRVRLRIAWRVFTGRYDALNWGEHSGKLNTAFKDCCDPEFFSATRIHEYTGLSGEGC
jgi:hypothetical protein